MRTQSWRRVAAGIRTTVYRTVSALERIATWGRDPLLPPAHLRKYYYGTFRPSAFRRVCKTTETEVLIHGLQPQDRVLDIGSGLGNLAISLIGVASGSYDGVEVHPEALAWCQRTITRRYPNFRFHHANVGSVAYNPRGSVPATKYRFPFEDASFDFIFLSSVFTHMLPDGVEQYVREIARVLAPGGVCVASYFLLNDQTGVGVDEGRSFMSFGVDHPSGLCRIHDAKVPEAAVALHESFVRRVHEQAGLSIRDIRRGLWWSGGAHDQDVLAVVHERASISAMRSSPGD